MNVDDINKWTGRAFSQRYYKLLEERERLPIFQCKSKFIGEFWDNQIVILSSPPESCKSLQVPQFILEEIPTGHRIACTQPRRVVEISCQVAEEMDVIVGEQVGYNTLFGSRSGNTTVLTYFSYDALMREVTGDKMLESYNVLILDEADERSLEMDFLIGYFKEVLKTRKDLKLVVMGATLDSEKFQTYFNVASLLKLPVTFHHVKIWYSQEAGENCTEVSIKQAVKIHMGAPPGDILVFLAGEEHIQGTCAEITSRIHAFGDRWPVNVVPLYPRLPLDLQHKVFEPFVKGGPRKIVVSTDKAEKCYTMDGISYVIDSGKVIQKLYNPSDRVEVLMESPISKQTADQRAQCAGRTQVGECFRLYTEEAYNGFKPESYPQMLTSNLSSLVLIMLMIGIRNFVNFDCMDPPAPETIMRALEKLISLGALDEDVNLTELGRDMSKFHLEPKMAKMLAVSPEFHCAEEILSISAMLSEPSASNISQSKRSLPTESSNLGRPTMGCIVGTYLMRVPRRKEMSSLSFILMFT